MTVSMSYKENNSVKISTSYELFNLKEISRKNGRNVHKYKNQSSKNIPNKQAASCIRYYEFCCITLKN